MTIGARDLEWAIVVASGEIEIAGPVPHRVSALAALRLDPGASLTFQATASPTLAIGVTARKTA